MTDLPNADADYLREIAKRALVPDHAARLQSIALNIEMGERGQDMAREALADCQRDLAQARKQRDELAAYLVKACSGKREFFTYAEIDSMRALLASLPVKP